MPKYASAFWQALLHPHISVCAGHALCHFGTLPGGWIRSQEGSPFPLHSEDGGSFPTWQPYSQDCQLKPLLGPYLQVSHCAQCILLPHLLHVLWLHMRCREQISYFLSPCQLFIRKFFTLSVTHGTSSHAGGSTSRGGKHTSCAASQCAPAWRLHRLQICAPLVQHQQA